MKDLVTVSFDAGKCREELDRFHALLASKQQLSERDDLQPLFKRSDQLSAFIGTRFPRFGPAGQLAYEFDILGDFCADIVIGNREQGTFCAVELEDARPGSVLAKHGRATKEWGGRFLHGFGQLADWFCAFDAYRNTPAFQKHFGYGHVDFFGLLLIGRAADLSDDDRRRIRWWSDRVSVNTHKIYCLTYDDLYKDLNKDWRLLSVGSGENAS